MCITSLRFLEGSDTVPPTHSSLRFWNHVILSSEVGALRIFVFWYS
jgi:hypothetical protein